MQNLNNIEISAYNPNWPKQFTEQADQIALALGDNCIAIHHVGSTSVPGLAAKPKIDIIAEVKDLSFDHKNLLDLNYEYRGGYNIPLRKSFTYRSKDLKVNLHVFEKNDPEIELNLLFRDYLRNNDQARDDYAQLKYSLIADEESHKKDGPMYGGYTLSKHDFIDSMLKNAGFNRLRFTICTHHAEWNAAKQYRNKYFFTPHNIQDPYTWTFDHSDHVHFILYKGTDIIGYAHIQLWPENRAAVRIIVVDEEKRNHGYGGAFMHLIEKWLNFKGYTSVHTESSTNAVAFYKKLSYISMPFNDPDGYQGGADDVALGKVLN